MEGIEVMQEMKERLEAGTSEVFTGKAEPMVSL